MVGDAVCSQWMSDKCMTALPPTSELPDSEMVSPTSVVPPSKKLRLSYDCDACSTTYTTKRSLLRHFKSTLHCDQAGIVPRPHPCSRCDSVFSRDDIRQRHEKEVHDLIKRNGPRRSIPRTSGETVSILSRRLSTSTCSSTNQTGQHDDAGAYHNKSSFNCALDETAICRTVSNVDSAYCGSFDDAESLTSFGCSQQRVQQQNHGNMVICVNDSAVDMTWPFGGHENLGKRSHSVGTDADDDNGSIRSLSTVSTARLHSRPAQRPRRAALFPQRAAWEFRDESDHLFCALCDRQVSGKMTEMRTHMNEHAKDYVVSGFCCQICQIGFAHEKDLIHHRIYSAQGHCGFDFDHAEPCGGHHPPDIFSDMLTDNDRLQFESKLRHWEKTQLNAYLQNINEIISRTPAHNVRSRWSIGALLDSFESLTSLMGDVRLSSDPDLTDYQHRTCGRRKIFLNRLTNVKSTYYTLSTKLKFISHMNVFKLTAKEKLLQLVKASMSGNRKQAELLLWAGADVNGSVVISDSPDTAEITISPAIATAWKGNTAILKALIEQGADINLRCNGPGAEHRTPLSAATAQGNAETITLLLASGASIDLTDDIDHGNALCCATKARNLDIVRLFLQNGANVNSRGGSCTNALGLAIHNGDVEIAEYLLQHGAHLTIDVCQHGKALECAASYGYLELVRILLQYGAKDRQHKALEIAAASGCLEVFEVLAGHNHEGSASQSDPTHLLAQACFWSREHTVRILLTRAVDLHLYNDDRCSNLAWALLGHSPAIVRSLLETGAQLMSKAELEFILFRSTEIWRFKRGMAEDSFATFEACCTAVTICKTLCAVMEDIESAPGTFVGGVLVLAMETFRKLIIWMREILVMLAGEFDLWDQAEAQRNLSLCFETLTYLEIKTHSHLRRRNGLSNDFWHNKLTMIQGLEPEILQPSSVRWRYRPTSDGIGHVIVHQ